MIISQGLVVALWFLILILLYSLFVIFFKIKLLEHESINSLQDIQFKAMKFSDNIISFLVIRYIKIPINMPCPFCFGASGHNSKTNYSNFSQCTLSESVNLEFLVYIRP